MPATAAIIERWCAASRVRSSSAAPRELEALDAALAAARAGAASTVLVSGEAGIGKTRLLAEFAARASAGGARVLIGNCIELGDGELPHAPLAAILRQLESELAPDELAAVLGPARAVLDPAAPENQASRLELVLAMLGRLGELGPAVIAIEDLHWADRSTRDLLAFLIRSLRREPIVLVATYRSDELHRRHPLRAFLAAHAGGGRADRAGALRRGRTRRGSWPRSAARRPTPSWPRGCWRARRATRSWPRSCSPPAGPSCPTRCARR